MLERVLAAQRRCTRSATAERGERPPLAARHPWL